MSVAVAALTVLAACSSSDNTSNGGSGGNSGDRIHGTVNVFTATSLTDAFDRIGMQFGHVPAGTTVRFTDGGARRWPLTSSGCAG